MAGSPAEEDQDEILAHVYPKQQLLIHLVRPDPKSTEAAARQGGQSHNASQRETSRPPTSSKLSYFQKSRQAELKRRLTRRQHEQRARLQIIQHWTPILEQERRVTRALFATSSHKLGIAASLARQVHMHWLENRLTSNQQAQRDLVVEQVQLCVDRKWPGRHLKVEPFGSSVTGIVAANSDIDLVLLDPARPLGVGTPASLVQEPDPPQPLEINGMPEWYDVRTIAKVIRKHSVDPAAQDSRPWFKMVQPIEGANVPIVSFNDRMKNFSFDLNINDRFGLVNSHMIRAYASLRPTTFRPLCFVIKKWLKRRRLNDPSGRHGGGASLSSYSIVLLVIQYYQMKGLLPNLQNAALLNSQNVSQRLLYRASKLPRKNFGDLKAGLDADTRKLQADRYDVTFLDATQCELQGVVTAIGSASQYRHWFRPETEEEKRAFAVIDIKNWDQDRERDLAQFGVLPSAADIGLHQTEASLTDSDTKEQVGHDLIGFVSWYSALDKRANIIDIKNGAPSKTNALATKRAWQAKFGYKRFEGIDSGRRDTDCSKSREKAVGPKPLRLFAVGGEETNDTADIGGTGGTGGETDEGSARSSANDEEQILVASTMKPAAAATAEDHKPDQSIEWEFDRILIRDPFIRDRNTAKNVGRSAADRLQREFERADHILTAADGFESSIQALLCDLWTPVEFEEAVKEERIQAQRDVCARERNGETLDGMVAGLALSSALDQTGDGEADCRRRPLKMPPRFRAVFDADGSCKGGRGCRRSHGRGRGRGGGRKDKGGDFGSSVGEPSASVQVRGGAARSYEVSSSSSSTSGFDSVVHAIFLPNKGRTTRRGQAGAQTSSSTAKAADVQSAFWS